MVVQEAGKLAEAAKHARQALSWAKAALLFSAAADALPKDPHGNVTASERSLHRDAYLCLNRTEQFQKHRERSRSMGMREDYRHDWAKPEGELVQLLLNPHGRAVLC